MSDTRQISKFSLGVESFSLTPNCSSTNVEVAQNEVFYFIIIRHHVKDNTKVKFMKIVLKAFQKDNYLFREICT